jgi:hypothetical protein
LIIGIVNKQCDQPFSYFLIENVSSDQPIMTQIPFLPKGYGLLHAFLKNNHMFWVGSIASNSIGYEEHEMSYMSIELRGVFIVYDLASQQLCFQKFIPGYPLVIDLIGTTLFIDLRQSEGFSLMGIDLKNWLKNKK